MTEIRPRLLAAAVKCISENGLAGTGSRDIAREAGINLSAITYHFGSKERLVSEALLGELRARLAPTFAVLRHGRDQPGEPSLLLATLIDSFEQRSDKAPLVLEAVVWAPHMEPLQAGLRDLWDELRRVLATHMSELQRSGEVARRGDPKTMAAVLVAVATGVVLQLAVDPQGPSMEAMVGEFRALLHPAEGPDEDAGS